MIILASSSPRRRELLSMIGLDYVIETSGEEEIQPHGLPPAEFVKTLALQKAQPIAALHPEDCVIGADTIVYLEGDILGKPHTPEVAKAYLMRMQGKSHVVFTGVAVLKNGKADVRHCETTVTFAPMTELEIDRYVATGEPLDKAGAYGVQGPGGVFVERVEGNYFNVIGLPLPTLYNMLTDAGEIII
ncbi:Septum formation protein Maf [bioreactor metagenome]|uniref:Septum formation protein Maf n=1 Tax=bioreactor metagenome TaxID=1076179 RepID=A0A645C2D9_9ZZZZ|nr:Maf family protein [Christensenella sp.]